MNSFGERISWKGNVPVTLYIHESVPYEFREDIKEAAAIWNAEKKLFVISDEIINGSPDSFGDSKNVISYISEYNPLDSSSEQAATKARSNGDQFKDTDIVINAFNFKYYSGTSGAPGEVSMLSLMVHELGHVLGLAHNEKNKLDVMYPYLQNNLMRTTLTEENKTSLKCEY